ncbi:hypothetical protein [Peribacillus muralis]
MAEIESIVNTSGEYMKEVVGSVQRVKEVVQAGGKNQF